MKGRSASRSWPELKMGSYLAFEALPTEARAGLIPVRVDPIEPVVALSFEPVPCGAVAPEVRDVGEWHAYAAVYRQKLDRLGVGKVAGALRAISEGHGGKGLVLLDHESPIREGGSPGERHGDTTPRTVFSLWWERQTGEAVPELLPDGTEVSLADLPGRVRPPEPKDWRQDRRWRDAPDVPWPPTEGDVLRWIGAVHWQTARSKSNPHQYNVVDWGPKLPFRRVVMWLREMGKTEVWGGETFRYKRIGDHKYWTMGHSLASTVVLNRKEWGQDPGDREGAGQPAPPEAAPAVDPSPETPLFDRDGRPLSLAERINAEHRAYALAAGAAYRHAVRCGALLREAKGGVPHGGWLGWVRANTELAPRTAQLYMMMSREAGEAPPGSPETSLRGPNTQHVAHLTDTMATGRETA